MATVRISSYLEGRRGHMIWPPSSFALWSSSDASTQSSNHHSLALAKVAQIITFVHFWGENGHLVSNIYKPTDRCHDNKTSDRCIKVIKSNHCWLKEGLMGERVSNYFYNIIHVSCALLWEMVLGQLSAEHTWNNANVPCIIILRLMSLCAVKMFR